MIKIATHDSVTGEKPKGFLSWLMIPFSRTQSKTIKEQYDAGCRMFDVRCRFYKNTGILFGAHGLFITKKTLYDILDEIDNFKEPCYISITYEGVINAFNTSKFINTIKRYKYLFRNIKWGAISAKYKSIGDIKVEYNHIEPAQEWDNTRQGFLPLDGKTWQTYIPIPWLWKKIYYNKPKFDEEVFTFVDFL